MRWEMSWPYYSLSFIFTHSHPSPLSLRITLLFLHQSVHLVLYHISPASPSALLTDSQSPSLRYLFFRLPELTSPHSTITSIIQPWLPRLPRPRPASIQSKVPDSLSPLFCPPVYHNPPIISPCPQTNLLHSFLWPFQLTPLPASWATATQSTSPPPNELQDSWR